MTAAARVSLAPTLVPDEPPDEALVRAALAGDEHAFRLLYRRHTPRLRRLAGRLLSSSETDVDDVLQTVWLRAMLGVAQFRWTSTLSSWLGGIVVRASMESMRSGRRWTTEEIGDDVAGPVHDIAARIDIDVATARVPDHYRVVFVLHDVEGFTHEEIAAQLGIAVGTSKANLHRARRMMRAMLGTRNAGDDT